MEFKKVKGLTKEIIKFYNNEQKNQNIPPDERENITNLRLQKVLFFIYGFYWKEKKQEIIDIEFHAWQYGPVVKELYDFIRDELDNSNKKRCEPIELEWFNKSKKPNYDNETFEKILNHLSQFSTIRLVNASHDTEPWLKTSNLDIMDKELIKKWFEDNVPGIA